VAKLSTGSRLTGVRQRNCRARSNLSSVYYKTSAIKFAMVAQRILCTRLLISHAMTRVLILNRRRFKRLAKILSDRFKGMHARLRERGEDPW
jgi:hypothetical protein